MGIRGGEEGPDSSQCESNYFTELCCGSVAGSYLRLIDFVYHSTLGLRAIKKKKDGPDELREVICDQRRQTLALAFR